MSAHNQKTLFGFFMRVSASRRGERWRRSANARIWKEAPPVAIRSTEKLARVFGTIKTPPKINPLNRMALSLDIGFSGVILPIAIAMSNFLKLVARSIEQGKCLGAALDRTGFDAVRAIRHLVSGDGLQQSSDEMVLPLF